LGEAGNFPAAMKTVAEWFPKKERGLAAGIFNSGTSIGVVIALLITPWILVNMGWQQVFIVTGALGFLWLILWIWLYEIPSKQKYLSREEFQLITERQEDAPQEETSLQMGPVIYLSTNLGVYFWQVPHRPNLLVFLILATFLFLLDISSRFNPAKSRVNDHLLSHNGWKYRWRIFSSRLMKSGMSSA
jgi:MFS family permease